MPLNKTADMLIPCANPACEEKWFVFLDGKPPVCPWCGTKVKNRFPVLEMYFAPKPGQFRMVEVLLMNMTLQRELEQQKARLKAQGFDV